MARFNVDEPAYATERSPALNATFAQRDPPGVPSRLSALQVTLGRLHIAATAANEMLNRGGDA